MATDLDRSRTQHVLVGSLALLGDHLAWVSGIVLVCVVAIKMAVVAHGDMDTMITLASHADTATVVLALVVAVVPAITTATLAAAIYVSIAPPDIDTTKSGLDGARTRGAVRSLALSVAAGALMVAAVSTPVAFVGLALVGPPLAIWGPRAARAGWTGSSGTASAGRPAERPRPRPRSLAKVAAGSLALSLILGLALIDDRPWVPRSEIQTKRGGQGATAYVIGRDDDGLIVLWPKTRLVARIPRSEVTYEGYCRPRRGPKLFRKTPVSLLLRRGDGLAILCPT